MSSDLKKTPALLTRDSILNCLTEYDTNLTVRKYIHNIFYQEVFRDSNKKSKFRSNDVFSNKNVTHDHYLSPRVLIRALLETEREIVQDETEFEKIFNLSKETVKVTKEQNNSVKVKNDGDDLIISELTINKYDKFAPWWDDENNDFDEFPLKERVPKFLTKFEKSKLR